MLLHNDGVYAQQRLSCHVIFIKTAQPNNDPLSPACAHTTLRLEAYFELIVCGSAHPLGRVTDWWYRIDDQHRGSLHAHMLLSGPFGRRISRLLESDEGKAELISRHDERINALIDDPIPGFSEEGIPLISQSSPAAAAATATTARQRNSRTSSSQPRAQPPAPTAAVVRPLYLSKPVLNEHHHPCRRHAPLQPTQSEQAAPTCEPSCWPASTTSAASRASSTARAGEASRNSSLRSMLLATRSLPYTTHAASLHMMGTCLK